MAALTMDDLLDIHGCHTFVVGAVVGTRYETMSDGTKFTVLEIAPMGADAVSFWVKSDDQRAAMIAPMQRGMNVAIKAVARSKDGKMKYQFVEDVDFNSVVRLLSPPDAASSKKSA